MKKSLLSLVLCVSVFPLYAMEQDDGRDRKQPEGNAPKSLLDCCKGFFGRQRAQEDKRSEACDEQDIQKVLNNQLPIDIACHVIQSIHQDVINKYQDKLGAMLGNCNDQIQYFIAQRLAGVEQCKDILGKKNVPQSIKCVLIERIPALQTIEQINAVMEQGPITQAVVDLIPMGGAYALEKAIIAYVRGALFTKQALSHAGNRNKLAIALIMRAMGGMRIMLDLRDLSLAEKESADRLLSSTDRIALPTDLPHYEAEPIELSYLYIGMDVKNVTFNLSYFFRIERPANVSSIKQAVLFVDQGEMHLLIKMVIDGQEVLRIADIPLWLIKAEFDDNWAIDYVTMSGLLGCCNDALVKHFLRPRQSSNLMIEGIFEYCTDAADLQQRVSDIENMVNTLDTEEVARRLTARGGWFERDAINNIDDLLNVLVAMYRVPWELMLEHLPIKIDEFLRKTTISEHERAVCESFKRIIDKVSVIFMRAKELESQQVPVFAE